VDEAASALRDELDELVEGAVTSRVVRDGDELERAATEPIEGPQLICVQGEPDEEVWRQLDRARERTRGASTRVLVVTARAVGAVPSSAPNFWSWLDSTRYSMALEEDVLSDVAREARLDAIREHYAGVLDDDSVVSAAERGTAPGDPDIAEWLVLLGRGDLLTRGGT
jgi:hypothetical protein